MWANPRRFEQRRSKATKQAQRCAAIAALKALRQMTGETASIRSRLLAAERGEDETSKSASAVDEEIADSIREAQRAAEATDGDAGERVAALQFGSACTLKPLAPTHPKMLAYREVAVRQMMLLCATLSCRRKVLAAARQQQDARARDGMPTLDPRWSTIPETDRDTELREWAARSPVNLRELLHITEPTVAAAERLQVASLVIHLSLPQEHPFLSTRQLSQINLTRVLMHGLGLVRCEKLTSVSFGPAAEHPLLLELLRWCVAPALPEMVRVNCLSAIKAALRSEEHQIFLHSHPPDAVGSLETIVGEFPRLWPAHETVEIVQAIQARELPRAGRKRGRQQRDSTDADDDGEQAQAWNRGRRRRHGNGAASTVVTARQLGPLPLSQEQTLVSSQAPSRATGGGGGGSGGALMGAYSPPIFGMPLGLRQAVGGGGGREEGG